MHGDVLSYVWSLRYPFLGRYLRFLVWDSNWDRSDRGMYNELWGRGKIIVRNILLVSECIRLLSRFRRTRNNVN